MARQKPTNWSPSPKQLAALETAKEIGLQRSISAVALESGVSRASLHDWLRDDADFKKAWESIPEQIITNHMPGIYSALIRKAIDGDVQAIKVALELCGKYSPTQHIIHSGDGKNPIKYQMVPLESEANLDLYERLLSGESRGGSLVSSGNGEVHQ